MTSLLNRLLTVRHRDADARRRGRNLIIVTLGVIVMSLASLPLVLIQPEPGPQLVAPLVGSVICGALIILARTGRVSAASVGLVTLILVGLFATPLGSRQVGLVPQFFIVAVMIAAVTARPWTVALTAATAVVATIALGVLLAGDPQVSPAPAEVVAVGAIIVVVGGLIGALGAASTTTAIQAAREARERAEQALAALDAANRDLEQRIAERTAALSTALAAAEGHAAAQERLLAENRAQQATIRAMNVPVLPVMAGTIVMPLVGSLDEDRLRLVQSSALAAIERHYARRLLVDVTGVPVIDGSVAAGLITTVQSARLLGAETVLIGVGPEVAQALVSLGLDLSGLRTVRDLREALGLG